MFDVFQSVFGKRKPSDGKPSDADGFVIVENQEKNDGKETTTTSPTSGPSFIKNPYQGLLDDVGPPVAKPNKEPESLNPMTVQDVPFKLNTALNASTLLDQIWKSIAPCMASISKPSSLQMEYDFSLERSVMSET